MSERARRIHLLRVEEEARAFGPLLVAAAAQGLRVGWLEMVEPPPVPEALRAVLTAGGARAVAVGAGWTVAARPRGGPAVLRDLLRQHFLGCALVLVRGEVEAALLQPAGEGGWLVTPRSPGGSDASVAVPAARRYAVDELLAALARPHPW